MEYVYDYDRVNWQNLPSLETPTSATNFNRMDEAIKAAHDRINELAAGLLDGAEVIYDPEPFELEADRVHYVDGEAEQALKMPPDPVQGARVAIYITGTSGTITLDGNGADLRKQGETELTLIGPGVEKLTHTVWQYIDYWATWVLLAATVTPTTDFIAGAGTAGLDVLKAQTRTDVRSVLAGENPIAVLDAHTAAPGEFIVCIIGGYTITIPEEAEHGDIITVVTDQQNTGIDVTVEWWDIQQDPRDTTLANTGQQLTLRYFKDLDLGLGPVSGWYSMKFDFVLGGVSP